MRDFWIAECLPCKWETRHDTEDSAIADAEAHVDALHRKVHPIARTAKYMGHVTQRTVMEPGDEPEPITAPAPALPAPDGIAPVPAADATPEPDKTGV